MDNISEKRNFQINIDQSTPPPAMQPQNPQQLGYQQAIVYNQQQYATPVIIQPNSNIIVSNQMMPRGLIISPEIFRKEPVSIICPFCQILIRTQVEQSFNCCACCLCCFTGLMLFLCIQICSGKDIGCMDATHRCPACGKALGQYTAI